MLARPSGLDQPQPRAVGPPVLKVAIKGEHAGVRPYRLRADQAVGQRSLNPLPTTCVGQIGGELVIDGGGKQNRDRREGSPQALDLPRVFEVGEQLLKDDAWNYELILEPQRAQPDARGLGDRVILPSKGY